MPEHFELTPQQLKAARTLLGQERIDVARRLAMTRETIRKAETAAGARASVLARLRSYYEQAGVEFSGVDEAGVRLRESDRAA